MSFVFVIGSNREGQAGIAHSDEIISNPVAVSRGSSDSTRISRIICSQKQTYVCEYDGSVSSAGENDDNELGRTGKRSLLQRIDSLEAFQIADVAVGNKFVLMACRDGKVVSWGVNDLGQLGIGNREPREKPKISSIIPEGVLQISAGAQHVVCLSRAGEVYTWGGNRKGQLGDGQLTSCCTPKILPQLRHRPVITIACGEAHSMALTVGNNVYAWGDNSCGQLGLGDTVHRLRPEFLRSIRAAKASRISCGRQHSMVVSPGGLLFAFGSNSLGQLGLGNPASAEHRIVTVPTTVDRFRETKVIEVTCGGFHTMVLCKNPDTGAHRLFGMGLNTSGQLGLGHTNNVYTPTLMAIPGHPDIKGIASGPLSMHSFVFCGDVPLSRPKLPAVDLSLIIACTDRLRSQSAATTATNSQQTTHSYHSSQIDGSNSSKSQETHVFTTSSPTSKSERTGNLSRANEFEREVALRQLREIIDTAFSSISVLNASFRCSGVTSTDHGHIATGTGQALDLEAVRLAYTRLFETGNSQLIATLSRATISMADKLIECPFDDQEDLAVFMIVLENPIILEPSTSYLAISRVISGILALPKSYRAMLFHWFKSYPSEYFCRTLRVFLLSIAYGLTREGRRKDIEIAPAVFVLASLFECNRDAKIVPESEFYCASLFDSINLADEWEKHLNAEATHNSLVFNVCSYPFLLDIRAKKTLLNIEFEKTRKLQIYKALSRYFTVISDGLESVRVLNGTPIPSFLTFHQRNGIIPLSGPTQTFAIQSELVPMLRITVRREFVLKDLIQQLIEILKTDKQYLFLPISASFVGEDAVDEGGIRRELFTLAIAEILQLRVLFAPCGQATSHNQATTVWFRIDSEPTQPSLNNPDEPTLEFCLGLLVGLACLNNICINVPLPAAIYKIMTAAEFNLSDLWAVDADLARGLQMLLDHPIEQGSISQVFGVNFTASNNPLVDSYQDNAARPNGDFINQQDEQVENSVKRKRTEDEEGKVIEPATVSSTRSTAYHELKPGGCDCLVDSSNRQEFVQLFVKHALYGSCQPKVDQFLSGLKMFLRGPAISICSHVEIEELICGSHSFDSLLALREHAEYRGTFHDSHPVIEWFWSILEQLSQPQKRKFLHFLSGSDRSPVGGLQEMRLIIQSTNQAPSALPVAHTCFNLLDLPCTYESREQLSERLLVALQHYVGFGLV